MSENNENKLEFDILAGNNTLTKELQNILDISGKIKAALGEGLSGGQNVTLVELKSIKTYLQEIHELSRIKVTLETAGKVPTGADYGQLRSVIAELKALQTQMGLQSQLSKQGVNELQVKAFAGKVNSKSFDFSDAEQRKAVKAGLEQRQAVTQLNRRQLDVLRQINKLDEEQLAGKKQAAQVAKINSRADRLTLAGKDDAPKTAIELKRSKELNVFQKARQGQLSPKDLQDFIAKGSQDPKRLVRELGAIQKQSRSAELDPNVLALHGNRPSLISGTIGIELSRLTQTIKEIGKADKEDRKKAASQQKIADNELLTRREKARTGRIQTADIRSEKNTDILKAYGQGFKVSAYDNKLSPSQKTEALAMQRAVEERLKTLAAKAPKPLDWVGETKRLIREDTNAAGQLNPNARPALRTKAERAFDTTLRAEAHNKDLLAHRASLTTATISNLANAKEISHATQAVKLHSKTYPEQAAANQALLDAIKARTKALVHAEKMRDPNFAAAERLKQEQANLRTSSVDSRSKGQVLADERAQAKVNAELEKRQAIFNGIYNTEAKLKALQPEQIKHARDTLNYQYQTAGADEARRNEAAKLLGLLDQIHGKGKASLGTNTLLADLEKTHYKTKESLRNLGREELQQAVEVLKYRRQIATTEQERKAAQGLLNNANQNLKLHPENQAEHRQGNRERVLGDAGASLLTIQAGLMLNYKLLGGFQSLFGSAISSAIELDSAFRQLQAISAATNYEMAAMKVNLIDVAQASKFSAAEVGNTAVLLAQAGLSIQEIGASMKGIITLAQATGTDLGKSVDVVTSVLSVFNKSAGETNQVVNQLTQALNSSKLDIQKVALGIQYAGNISADAGVTFEELTSALGAMANAGIRSGSTLGTGFRQMLLDLERPSTKLKERLDKLGLSLNEIDFRAYGLAGVLKNLREAGFTTADAFKTFEVRSAAAFSALSGNLQDFDDLQEELLETNAAFEANHVQLEALAVQLDHLKSNLGIVAAEGLRPMTALTRDVAKGLAHMMENAEEGSGALQVMGTAIAAITGGIALAWLARLVPALWNVATAAGGVRAAFVGNWLGIVAAVGIGTAAWVAHNNELERLTTELDTAKGKFNEAKETLAGTEKNLNNVDEAIKKLIDKYGVLSASQSATTSEAKSLQKQFEELGIAIGDVSTVKVPELLEALAKLKGKQIDIALSQVVEKATVEQEKLRLNAEETAATFKSQETKDTLASVKTLVTGREKLGATLGEQFSSSYLKTQREAVKLSEGTSPEVKAGFKQLSEAFTFFQSSGKLPSNLNLAKAKYDLTNSIRSQGLGFVQESKQVKLLEEIALLLQKADTVSTVDDDIRKSQQKSINDTFNLGFEKKLLDAGTAVGASQKLYSMFKLEQTKVDKQEALSSEDKKISVGRLAQSTRTALGREEQSVKSLMRSLPEDPKMGSPEALVKNARQGELNTIVSRMSELDPYIKEMETILNKRAETAIDGLIQRLQQELKLLKKRHAKADSLPTASALGKEVTAKFEELQVAQERADKLKGKSLTDIKLRQQADRDSLGDELAAQVAKVQDFMSNSQLKLDEFNTQKEIEAYAEAQGKWIKDREENEKLWTESKEAEFESLRRRTASTLSSSDMFSGVNKDLAKRAQVIANRTGLSQNYSQYGTGASGFFAKQAEKRKRGALELKLQQEKLARSLVLQEDLKPQMKADSDKIDELNISKKLSRDRLQFHLENSITGQVSSEEVTKEIKAEEANLKNIEDLLKIHQGNLDKYNQLARGARETEAKALEMLRTQVIDPEEEMMRSLRAGQEAMSAGLSTFMGDWASGMIQNTEDVRDAFEAMGKSILQSMLKVISDRTATRFTNMLLGDPTKDSGLGLVGTFGSWIGSLFGGTSSNVAGVPLGSVASSLASTTFGSLIDQGAGVPIGTNSVLRRANGGMVKGYSGGGYVSGTGIGRDSVPAMLMPNEYVLRPSATSALGKPFLDRLNATTTGSLKQLEGKAAAPQINVQGSPPVNVYVVSPDQQNQMGVNDVVVAVEDNISRNGSIKQLIKQVISGEA